MKVAERASLKDMNSFGLGAAAGLLLTIETEEDVLSLPSFDPARDLVLGEGSNVILELDTFSNQATYVVENLSYVASGFFLNQNRDGKKSQIRYRNPLTKIFHSFCHG